MEGFTREQLDEVGYRSQQRAAEAVREGRFAKSIIPVTDDEGNVLLDHDEYARPETTREGLAQLEPAFTKIADVPLDENEPVGAIELALWFTGTGDLNAWSLFSQETSFAGGGHGLAHGIFYDSRGRILAVAGQNALMRFAQ